MLKRRILDQCGAKTLDPGADLVRAGFEGDAVDDQAGGNLGDDVGLDQAVGFQRAAGLHQVDDQAGQAKAGGQLHRAVQGDDFGLDAAAGEMPAGDVGVFAGDADAGELGKLGQPGFVLRLGDGNAAMADIEVERGVNFRVVEFHQHVAAANADLGGAEGNEGGDVEGADADDVEAGMVGGEAQAATGLIGVIGRGNDAGSAKQRGTFVQNTAFGEGEHNRHGGGLAPVGINGQARLKKDWGSIAKQSRSFLKEEPKNWI